MHDEAECDGGNVPDLMAGIFETPSVRATRHKRAAIRLIFRATGRWLAEITGFAGVSLQPNAGSQGEYAGLLVDSGISRNREAKRIATFVSFRHPHTALIPPARSWPD